MSGTTTALGEESTPSVRNALRDKTETLQKSVSHPFLPHEHRRMCGKAQI